jgi:hypothetical protein
MRRLLKLGLLALTIGGSLTACVVHERVVARPATPCAGGYRIEGHYDRYGHWHGAHWHCPGRPYNVY